MGTLCLKMRSKTISVPKAGTPVRIMEKLDPDKIQQDFELYVPSGNAGSAFIGDIDVNAADWIPREKGAIYNFVHGDGRKIGCEAVEGFDLSQLYVDVENDGDSVIIQYYVQTNTDKSV